MERHFKRYRKLTPTVARLLTQQDFEYHEGRMITPEGSARFVAGDYLARDGNGQWPIWKSEIEQHYRLLSTNAEGWSEYECLDIRKATQMTKDFLVNGLLGKAGDYLVRAANGREWPVEREVFETGYVCID